MEINFMQVLFQAVNFGVIFFVLVKFLYKPIQKVLDDRRDKINDGMRAAEKNIKAESELEELKKKQLASSRREAAKLVKTAKADASSQADEIIKKARAQAKLEAGVILETAASSAKDSEQKMADSLKDLTIATTRKLLADSLSDKDIKSITTSMVKKLK